MSFDIPSLVEKSLESITDAPTQKAIEENLSYQDRENELKLVAIRENIEAKRKYAHRLFLMLCVWLTLVLILLLFQGFGKIPFTESDFELSEAVLITLITTTTANVAAFFLVVTNHLFPNPEKVS